MDQELLTATHEAGHALVALALGRDVGVLSIESRGGRAGVASIEDAAQFDDAVIDYAGHAAVAVVLGQGDMTDESASAAGAGSDFESARGKLDPDRVNDAKARAVSLVSAAQGEISALANALLELKTIDPQYLDLIVEHGSPVPPWLGDMARIKLPPP